MYKITLEKSNETVNLMLSTQKALEQSYSYKYFGVNNG